MKSTRQTSEGRRLRMLRKKRGLSQRALAEKSGLSQTYLSLLEGGTRSARDLRRPSAIALAAALGVSVDHLQGAKP